MRIRRALTILGLIGLLVPALLLTAARLVAAHAGLWVYVVAFTPFAVPLYAGALLVLLVVLLTARGGRRTGVRGLIGLALAGLVVHLAWLSPAYVGGAEASASKDRLVTVVTANLRLGRADATRIVELAVRNRADVLVLEEVTPEILGRLEAVGLDEVFPHSVGEPAAGPAGTMLFATGRLDRRMRLDTALGGYRARVHLPQGAVTVLAVHPRSPIGDTAEWARDHRRVIAAAARTSGPTMIVGDLNATLDHQPLRELAGRGFTDAARDAKSRWQPTWPAAGEVSLLGMPVPSLLQLDHVLVNEGLRAHSTASVTVGGTDHRALVARLAFR